MRIFNTLCHSVSELAFTSLYEYRIDVLKYTLYHFVLRTVAANLRFADAPTTASCISGVTRIYAWRCRAEGARIDEWSLWINVNSRQWERFIRSLDVYTAGPTREGTARQYISHKREIIWIFFLLFFGGGVGNLAGNLCAC